MRVTYTPAGTEPQVWDFKPKLVLNSLAEVIEKRSGLRFDQWVDELLAGSAKARRVLLWHLICREHGHLKLEDVDFAMGELTVERDLAELIEFRAVVVDWKGDEDTRRQGLEEIDAEIAALEAAGAEVPKAATSPSADPGTPWESAPTSG